MKIPCTMPRLKGYRSPREIVAYAVWTYNRFALSTADVEDLLAERGVMVSRETVRNWVNRFGRHFAECIKRDRLVASDKWHLDEVVVPINGVKFWLWRAIDENGNVLDILVQKHRNAKAARRFLKRRIDRFGAPRVVITDKLRSYIKPIRKREKIVGRFKSHRQAQRFLFSHDQINLIFRPRRSQLTETYHRHTRVDAFSLRADYTAEMTS